MEEESYRRELSRVSAEALRRFVESEPSEDVGSVPGVGKATAEALARVSELDSGARTTHQLLGKFLTLREPGMDAEEHVHAFWFWLKAMGVGAERDTVCHAVSEKVRALFPKMYADFRL